MKENIYRLSPFFLKVMLLNLVAFRNHRKRYSKKYYKYLEIYTRLWSAERDEVLSYQKTELIKLLKECYQFVPYYKELFDSKKLTISDIENEPFEVLNKLPILDKKLRKSDVSILVNQNPKRIVTEVGFTSGTTGAPTVNYLDAESIEKAFALWDRFKRVIGIHERVRNVRFSGRIIINPQRMTPPFWINNYIDSQLLMSSYHLKEENIEFYISKLNKFSPQFIDGYPSAIYIIAKFINTRKYPINFNPKVIATTAETLYDYQREEIEKAFQCKVYNQYASSEGSPFITECSKNRLHINEDSGVFEFFNVRDQVAQPGDIARMVVTSFRNWKTPLLRYDIGDSVFLPKKTYKCECGCNMPYVDKIIGREDDILWTREKGYVGRLDTAYKGLKGIVKSQIVQKSPNLIIVNNIIDDKYGKEVQLKLISNLKDRLGEDIDIRINIVNNIPLGKNGKFDAVKREFKL